MLPTVMLCGCVILLLQVVMSLLICFSQNVCRVKHMLRGVKERICLVKLCCLFVCGMFLVTP